MAWALATPVNAADCPRGQFCVWENAYLDGQRANWSGEEVGCNGVANDRGDSHTWAMTC